MILKRSNFGKISHKTEQQNFEEQTIWAMAEQTIAFKNAAYLI